MPAASVAALVMAAGHGARFGGKFPKQYQPLLGVTPLARALAAFHVHPAIGRIACVVDAGEARRLEALENAAPVDIVAVGGATRQDSVRAGLEALAAAGAPEFVLIHDAARPLVPTGVIDALIAKLQDVDAAAPALALPDTISHVEDGAFGQEVPRERLVRRQTPQAFRFAAILDAHRRFKETTATDDIALARAAGLSTAAVAGAHALHKLTTPEDRNLLEAMISQNGRPRVGNGFDVHRFGAGDSVILCGVAVPHDQGLVGHSDADVAMHALTDAMLGCVGAGDIGQLFPPSDPQWKGAPSRIFLERALAEIEDRGGVLENVDVTIICERPKVGPYRDAMRVELARLLRLDVARVNVKATTTEGLGFTGRGEGVAAMATASAWMPT